MTYVIGENINLNNVKAYDFYLTFYFSNYWAVFFNISASGLLKTRTILY
jgi:hypothetical protein